MVIRVSRAWESRSDLPELGPFPIEDILGIGAAVDLVIRSLDKTGKYRDTIQFDTARRVRSVYNNLYRASAKGQKEWSSYGTKHRIELTRSPVQSEWWTRFVRGVELRMGVDSRPDLAISIELMLEIMRRFTDSRGDKRRRRGRICTSAWGLILSCVTATHCEETKASWPI